jgi:class 3 adenylate cyclase
MTDSDPGELRLFLEEVVAGLRRHRHVTDDGLAPEAISVIRELRLGDGDRFADIRVEAPPAPPYFVEVKYGLPPDDIVHRLAAKFAGGTDGATALLVVAGDIDDAAAAQLRDQIAAALPAFAGIEVWHERRLVAEINAQFGLQLPSLSGADLQSIRDAIVAAEWRHAFATEDRRMAQTLLWHFGPWTLKSLHEAGLQPHEVVAPGNYRELAVLMADLCSFSSYVRDTRDDDVVRRVLTAFYSQARHAVLEAGGMLYQFVGDEVVALFGFPRSHPNAARDAVLCAQRLLDIGNSISDHWQRRLDRIQKSRGVHIGISRGDLNLMPLRAFSRRHIGFVGDSINMAARLMAAAGPGEIAVSNSLYQGLPRDMRARFHELPPLEAKNIGLIKGWQLDASGAEGQPAR